MPKDRRDRSISFDRCRSSPYTCSSSCSRLSSPKIPSDTEENLKEWEEARCPVCMEHPHNAVLLICSSHDKGCRPYMCDTSYRHSNCLDQFRKSFAETTPTTTQPQESRLRTMDSPSVVSSVSIVTVPPEDQSEEGFLPTETISCENKVQPKIVCPLCRGQVKEWIVTEPARSFMNAKPRGCACETCYFTGTYSDLRKHARLEHPLVRPSEADPERQRNWRRLERQRDLGDLLSTLQSSFGEERGDENLTIDDGGWLTVFFLIRVFRPGSSPRSSSWSGTSRAARQLGIRRRATRHWGENHEGETGSSSREDDNDSSDGGSGPWRRSERIRRRTTPDQL
ncbi:hypothetical protein OIU76_026637 [Salix suchowensis]|uniref:Uncharacterized protein n=2 Tax=Salix TaxID=40685 RepID=A0A9Q0W5E1_9ROSI|nr:GPI-anchored adhesin protein [Salix suchowensis]KAJ6295814.1 hypothetical protein OIU78_023773 [Salix suchowensis]KAJ6355629.1 hypothetical protein OIU77_006087 [Salix suchowensis]KAJ6372193.1 hypothetical protein OIU76_026637 [Salix suchowensis]KAJ6759533.1 hypothetical protein OIU74_026087 [Salix koriyanagi]